MRSASDFTGRGWAFPLRLDSAGSFVLSGGEQEIEEAIRLILGTSFGERPLRPEYGCGIHDLVFDTVDAGLSGKVAAAVRASLTRWEPRIDVTEVSRRAPARPAARARDLPSATGSRPPTTGATSSSRSTRSLRSDPMPLPAPNLDDRRFQDFVDDAKRLIQRRIPAWTDHNVHDPGVTLIEAVATIADQLGYRLNQVPERHYRKFLDLLGITLRPPAAARADADLPAVRPAARAGQGARPERRSPRGGCPANSRSPSPRSPTCSIVPVSLTELRAAPAVGDEPSYLTDLGPAIDRPAERASPASPRCRGLATGSTSGCPPPRPRCMVLLRTDSEIEGIGVDPEHPAAALGGVHRARLD